MTIKEIRLLTGMGRKEFAEYFNIPYRTLQNWELELREAPEYVMELIKYKIIKEKLNMKKELSILMDKEDRQLTLSYRGIDLENYDYITIEEFIEEVENVESWDMIEPEVYEKALEEVGLDCNNYDDPDTMWEDFLKKVSD